MASMTRAEYDAIPIGQKPWPDRSRVVPGKGRTEEERYNDGIEAGFTINVHNLLSGAVVYTSEKDPVALGTQAIDIMKWFHDRGWMWCDIMVSRGRYGWMKHIFTLRSKTVEDEPTSHDCDHDHDTPELHPECGFCRARVSMKEKR